MGKNVAELAVGNLRLFGKFLGSSGMARLEACGGLYPCMPYKSFSRFSICVSSVASGNEFPLASIFSRRFAGTATTCIPSF